MKKALLFVTALLPACLAFTQTSPVPVGPPTPHSLLWKITGKGLTMPSWLFGTMHIMCADDAKISDSLKTVIAHCAEVYFEIKLDDMSGMVSSMKYMRMNDSKKLSDLLSGDDYEKVKNYFSKHASLLPFGMLERFKPLLISGMLEGQGLSCGATDGMEMMIMKEAHRSNKPINGLETAEFQAGLLDSIPYEKQAKDLVNYIDSAEEYKKMTLELAEVYKKQDLDQIDSLSSKGDPGMNGYMDLMLYDRNRKWAKALDSLLPGKSLLVAVGAAHLPGQSGVISLLRKEGYTVEPVNN